MLCFLSFVVGLIVGGGAVYLGFRYLLRNGS